ncbi:hypothetical protein QYE76_020617 [Lolium multiflorum]|uniref:Arabidopsis retrotransposon Orf1 C-terminal domain-containing protein n=1 Tax=Lolium multiflorum TaxID=4521 RepID=A0AAD8R6K6_LOLMU|nr:hypothetical protein QYE76_020617 [Lolium multiflorum]
MTRAPVAPHRPAGQGRATPVVWALLAPLFHFFLPAHSLSKIWHICSGLLDDFLTLVDKAGLTTYMEDEMKQYYMLTKIFVESFKFNNKHYHPTVAFKIYGNPITMKLKDFCTALDIAPVGSAKRIEDNPKALLELYREITNDDCRTIHRGKIRNIQLPAIKYFAYYLATSILGRENTSNISSYHLAFLIAALTGETPYHLGALVARRLSNKGPIFGGIIASRILAHLDLPLDPTDVELTPARLDIAAMKSHQFVTTDSSMDNIVYRMLFADGDERAQKPKQEEAKQATTGNKCSSISLSHHYQYEHSSTGKQEATSDNQAALASSYSSLLRSPPAAAAAAAGGSAAERPRVFRSWELPLRVSWRRDLPSSIREGSGSFLGFLAPELRRRRIPAAAAGCFRRPQLPLP